MFLVSAIILLVLFFNFYLQCLFYGSLRKAAIYTNIHVIFITGGILLNFLLAIVYQYINAGRPFLTLQDLPGFYTQGWPIMLQTFVLLYVVYFCIRYFTKRFKEHPNGSRRFFYEIPVVLLLGFSISQLFYWIFVNFMVVPEEDMAFLQRKLKMILMIDLAFLIVVYASMTAFRIFRYLQQKNVELARWQREYTQSQFEAMKNQLNPHFLFNSLNALSSLVYADADLAESFIGKLSRSYRYLLEQRDRTTVELKHELNFLDNYRFLLEQRYGKKLSLEVDNMNVEQCYLPPHSLMIILDHIMETNIMSVAKPLQVKIYRKDDRLFLEYNAQPKTGLQDTNDARINRLKEEFEVVSNRSLNILEEKSIAKIAIPLNYQP